MNCTLVFQKKNRFTRHNSKLHFTQKTLPLLCVSLHCQTQHNPQRYLLEQFVNIFKLWSLTELCFMFIITQCCNTFLLEMQLELSVSLKKIHFCSKRVYFTLILQGGKQQSSVSHLHPHMFILFQPEKLQLVLTI